MQCTLHSVLHEEIVLCSGCAAKLWNLRCEVIKHNNREAKHHELEDIHSPQRSFAKGMEGDYTSTDVAAAEGSKVILEHK